MNAKLITILNKGKPVGIGFRIFCPAHDDKNQELCIYEAPDGRILTKCAAGCSSELIMEAIDMEQMASYLNGGINDKK